MKNTLAALLAIGLAALAVYTYVQTSALKTRVQALDATMAARSASDTLELQAKCARQAEIAVNALREKHTGDGFAPDGSPAPTRVNFSQRNHYNRSLDKCYVLVTYDHVAVQPNFITSSESLLDAFEGEELATCVHSQRLPYGQFGPQVTDTCLIGFNRGTVPRERFEEFVNQMMETVR